MFRSRRSEAVRRDFGSVAEPRIAVITVSTRAAGGEYTDRSGPVAVAALRDLGYDVDDAVVVADGEPVRAALTTAISDGFDVVVTTGGTGLAPDDLTPDVTLQLLDKEVPGVMEAIREFGRQSGIDKAALSRGVCGVAGRTFIVNLPGSTGGVRDGITVLAPILNHVLEQMAGADH